MSDWTLTAAGTTGPILSASLEVPRVGNFLGDLQLDWPLEAELPTGRVELGLYQDRWQAFVLRAARFAGAVQALVVGGRGGLWKALPPRSYQGVALREVLRRLLEAAGEELAADSSAQVLAQQLPRWVQVGGLAERGLSTLLEGRGVWRVRPDGTLWVGTESWPAAAVPDQVDVLDEPGADNVLVLAAESCAVYPGTTWGGRRISNVLHTLAGDQHRITLVFEEEGATQDRLREALAGFVRDQVREVDYLARYTGRVKQQRQDGTVDVQPDDPRLAGLPPLPVRFLPGCRVELSAEAQVLVGFENGSPAAPFCEPWGAGSLTKVTISAQTIELKASSIVVGDGTSTVRLAGGNTPVARTKEVVTGTANLQSGAVAATITGPGNGKVLA